MSTTIDLPEDLLNEAMKTAKVKTKVIITALEELIRKHKISGLKQFKGKVEQDIVPIFTPAGRNTLAAGL